MAKEAQNRWLVTHTHPKMAISEAFKLIRTNLKFSQVGKKLQTIMLTSSGPSEGKSTVAANLAVTLAQGGNKTLVVDCDLRKPVQHKIFDRTNIMGLTNLLVDETAGDLVQETGIDGLYLLTSGPIPPNPSELLGSQGMHDVIENFKSEFDIILFDSPPVIAVSDAAVLSPQVDGVIMVIRAYEARIDLVKEAKQTLDRAGANIVGSVLNDVKIKSKNYHYYYYYEAAK